MTPESSKKIRESLHLLELKTADDINSEFSNIDDILDHYSVVYKYGREFVNVEGKTLVDALSTQPSERQFFGYCAVNLRRIVKVFEARLASERSKVYSELLRTEPRDLTDRALNQVVDGNENVYTVTMELLKIREYSERFADLVESYNQRGFTLNNLTKSMQAAIEEMEING